MMDAYDDYEGKTVLVTGGAGAIGGNLVRQLNDLDTEKIIILDNRSSSCDWNVPVGPKIHFVHGDILDDEKLKFAFKDRPDIVFHLAAHFANQNSVDNPETGGLWSMAWESSRCSNLPTLPTFPDSCMPPPGVGSTGWTQPYRLRNLTYQ